MPSPLPPRFAELWAALKTRLDTGTMQAILGGAGRVYLGSDDYSAPEDLETAPWGRVVLEGGRHLFPLPAEGSVLRPVLLRVVGEMNDYAAAGYDPLIPLEAIQQEAYVQLQWWEPAGLVRYGVGMGLKQEEGPQVQPEWDETRRLWWTSSLYRCEAATVVPV